MISDTSLYHGAFFALLLEEMVPSLAITRLSEHGSGYYLLGSSLPVYLKHSKRRKGPWQFNFFRSHQEKQAELHAKFGECITGLICGRDGIAGLTMSDLRSVLDTEFEEQECISVRRGLRGQYEIRGRNGILGPRVSRSAVFSKIQTSLQM